MSDFLGRAGRITEWVVISNLGNRAVNAACDKTQDWWKNRKQGKHHQHGGSGTATPPQPPAPVQSQAKYPDPSAQQYPPQQGFYMPPPPPPPPMGGGQLIISVNQVDGLNQWGPLLVIIECNYQRYTIPFSQFQQQFTFPINQIDYDQVLLWIQTEHQQQTIAHGEIPVRILLNSNNNNQWNPQQQRWIPLRDNYNGPAGQLLVTSEYRTNYSSASSSSQGPPPPYPYYS